MSHYPPQPAPSQCTSAAARRAMSAWIKGGGALPTDLLAHMRDCPACTSSVRGIHHVQSSLALLKGTTVPPGCLPRSNQRAMGMLRRVTRASRAAERALRTQPRLSLARRFTLQVARVSLSAATAVLLLFARVGIWQGLDQARAGGEALAQAHWDRHIDPKQEWLERDRLTS